MTINLTHALFGGLKQRLKITDVFTHDQYKMTSVQLTVSFVGAFLASYYKKQGQLLTNIHSLLHWFNTKLCFIHCLS